MGGLGGVYIFDFFEPAKEFAIFIYTPPCKNTGRLKKKQKLIHPPDPR